MATSIVMPQMGYDMQEGTVVRWYKQEGEAVARGEVIADIETDKATVEFEAYTSGVLRKIVVDAGIAIPVGQLIAVITDPDEPLPDDLEGLSSPSSVPPSSTPDGGQTADNGASQAAEATPVPPAPPSVAAPAGEVRASPIARRLAKEKGIDLTQVTGTGPGGRIRLDKGSALIEGGCERLLDQHVLACVDGRHRQVGVAGRRGCDGNPGDCRIVKCILIRRSRPHTGVSRTETVLIY